MKEKLIDVVKAIVSCANARKGTSITPVARVHCLFDGNEDTYWFTSSYYSGYDLKEIKEFGHFVPKNSNLAIKMQTYDVGTSFEYEQMNNIKRMKRHFVMLENRADFQNQTIAIAGDNVLYRYRNIREFLDALNKNREDIKKVEEKISELKHNVENLKTQGNTARQRGQITKSINELQKEHRILTQQQEDLKNITIYIRKQGEMRYSLIVDAKQTQIKSQHLFDGKTVIIDGGPGTGKSTTMIHRLAYLTDTFAIDEDENNHLSNFKLNVSQRQLLRDAIRTQRDWMFFSPSQLLKEYLADAMKKERLTNTSQKVWNWKDYRRLILQENYGLLGTAESNAPFVTCNLMGTLFYQNSGIIDEFSNFYLAQLRGIKSKLPRLNTGEKEYAWIVIAKSIQQRFEGSDTFDIGRFISLFDSLESVYANDCKDLIREKNVAVSDMTTDLCALLEKNKSIKSDIEDILKLSVESEVFEEEKDLDEIDEKMTETVDSSSNKGASSPNALGNDNGWFHRLFGFLGASLPNSLGDDNPKEEKKQDKVLYNELQKWLKAYCDSKINGEVPLSDEYQMIGDILLPLINDEKFESKIQKINNLIVFEHFAKYTRGVKSVMLSGIPALYKKFRTNLSKTKYEGCNLQLLRDIMQRKHGKELHNQEQSLLLGFINTLVKQIKTYTNVRIKHPYIEAYEEVSRPIIGIDEATDFSACDIYAMQSLLAYEYNSLTLCGDMMQRMTADGIKSWSELNGIVREPVVVELETSYRQSKKLLDVASRIHVDTLGIKPGYKAFMKSSKVPAPLVYIDENETSKIQWISKRISEVSRAYGEMFPSIAIFVNDKGYIPRFIESLQKTDFFMNKGVMVVDGTIRNSKNVGNHICVYPIDVVKGMEFDVVFFHNIDNSSEDIEMLKRYIYVGVSRAAFFLGATLSEQNYEISKYFEQNKDWFNI